MAKDKDMRRRRLPPSVSARLPKYYRTLRELIGTDILRVSSGELAKRMRLTPSQVRQDFSYLGGVGQQGYGYNVKDLYSAIGAVIGIPRNYSAIIICRRQQFGSALAKDPCFSTRGVNLKYIFSEAGDFAPSEHEVGITELGTRAKFSSPAYERAADYCRRTCADIAVLACDRTEADAAAEALESAGIRGIWNFTGKDLSCDVPVLDMNLSDMLLRLCCEITAETDE